MYALLYVNAREMRYIKSRNLCARLIFIKLFIYIIIKLYRSFSFFFFFSFYIQDADQSSFILLFQPLNMQLQQVTRESVPDFLVVQHLFNGSITELKAKFENHIAKELD